MADSGAPTPSVAIPSLGLGRWLNMSVMMFLQFAVWGAWFVVLGLYLDKGLKFTGAEIGWIYGTMALGGIFAPMVIGQIADRYFASEILMALLHLVGAALLVAMANVANFTNENLSLQLGFTQVKVSFLVFFVIALAYSLVYSPTLVLSNSITFSHVPKPTYFPWIRVWGTIGWIVANWSIVLIGGVPRLRELFGDKPEQTNLPLYLAAGMSVLLGAYSFLLPHTPPAGKAGSAFPALRAVGLLRSPSFAVFFGVSFIITIVLAFYYSFAGIYLGDQTIPRLPTDRYYVLWPIQFKLLTVANIMTIGQIAEMILLPFLPLFLRYVGMKWVLAVGMLAWGVRYLIFSLASAPGMERFVGPWVVVGSLALHGVCFDFFFAAGFIYVDTEAPREIRASAQALFTFLTYGLGMWLGNIVSGYVVDLCSYGVKNPTHDWYTIWLVPSVGVLFSLAVFILFFHMRPQAPAVKSAEIPPGPRDAATPGPAPASTDIVSQPQKEGVY
jgi:nucleoside transporter